MALGINTNVASLSAQNQLNRSQQLSNQALERLSSGLRINSAKDDAAGLAISTRFQSQISGLNVAQRNANDGISLAQTTEGALEEITNNLQRIRELAVQSANATNSASDRQALNDEVQQRIAEIDRISSQTAFNGLKVLDGTFGQQNFQVGANAGETIGINLTQGTRADQIGATASADISLDGANLASGSFDLRIGSNDPQTFEIEANSTAASIAEAVRSANIEGVTAVTAENRQTFTFANVTLDTVDGGATPAEVPATYEITIAIGSESETISFAGLDDNTSPDFVVTAQDVADGINNNAVLRDSGVSASVVDGDLVIETAGAENFDLTQAYTQNDGSANTNNGLDGAISNYSSAETFAGTVSIDALESIRVDGASSNNVVADQTVEASGAIEDIDISTVDGANSAIGRIDAALTTVNGLRGELGAIQNRFESTIANLATSVENLSASNSRILDADFAAETAKLSKAQVLQQAGISVLAQANARPQQVLSLLQ